MVYITDKGFHDSLCLQIRMVSAFSGHWVLFWALVKFWALGEFSALGEILSHAPGSHVISKK